MASRTTTRGGSVLPRIPQYERPYDDSPDPLIEICTRFLAKVAISDDPFNWECWLWQGRVDELGYGQFKCFGFVMNAHRVAWMLKHRQWPGKWLIRHTCANKSCVNPDHLKRGTFSQNERDTPYLWKNQHGIGGK